MAPRYFMTEKPFIGQVVVLNDAGKRHINGLTSDEMVRQAKRMVITHVHDVNMGHLNLWEIEVDQPTINVFMLDNSCVDPFVPEIHENEWVNRW